VIAGRRLGPLVPAGFRPGSLAALDSLFTRLEVRPAPPPHGNRIPATPKARQKHETGASRLARPGRVQT